MTRHSLPAGLAAALMPFLIVGCAPAAPDARSLEAALTAAAPEVDGVLVGESTDGFGRSVLAKLYLPEAESLTAAELGGILDRAYRTLWLESAQPPASVGLGVVPGEKPRDALMGDNDVVRFDEAFRELGMPLRGTQLIHIAAGDLAAHYGERTA